jgi:hypothetical protein
MNDGVHGSATSRRGERRGFVKRVLAPIAWLLRTGEEAATIDRLFVSQHVADLRLIVAFASVAVMSVLVIGLALSAESEAAKLVAGFEPGRSAGWWFLRLGHHASVAVGNFLTFFGPVLAVFGAVLAWAYQVGSARLGLVDLFACEISTLCRVATVVDSVGRSVDRFNKDPPVEPAGADKSSAPARAFTSEEDYFPVFGANARDLQTLEARVVINITAFYTYMKAVRDSARASAEIGAQPGGAEARRAALRDIVYMMFLGLESARHAIADLVEFEPEEAERTIVILISELEAYRFLCGQFDGADMRRQRIALRASDYQEIVPKLCHDVAKAVTEKRSRIGRPASRWEPARILLPELQKRYHDAVAASDAAPADA